MKIALIILVAIAGVLLLRAGLVALSVPAYNLYWQKKAQERAKANTITLISLGDSAAQGVGASSPSYSYVGRLASSIETQTKRPVKVINLSKSGARIADVTNEQLPKLTKLKITGDMIITMDIGTNDVTHTTYDDGEFAAQLNKLFAQLPKQTIVADMPYLGKSRWASKCAHSVGEQNT